MYRGYADRALVPVDMSFDAPASLADEQAAAFLIPFHTAHLALHRRGRLQAENARPPSQVLAK